ncbi:dihydroflavonol 4-reductase [candidate division KSB1 bacterium]|nr:MAG: dihydroflavonol 4-reductase [candidate division KSB1 bacterium]HDI52435.1 NAD-dependent epimerase/dehydratase family protein [Bacteroidota bacterium]
MRVLVLGATGFIGFHVTQELLRNGFQVRILRRKGSPVHHLQSLTIEQILGDLNDLSSLISAMDGCEVVFHCAGYYPIYSLARRKQVAIATQQIHNVCEAARQTNVRRLIYTSSPSTIGQSQEGKLANEQIPYSLNRNRSTYCHIKYVMEQKVLEAAQNGVPAIIINPTGVFGPYDIKPTTGRIILELLQRRMLVFVNGKLNAVDVRDVARAEVLALKKGRVGERYIIGNWNTTLRDFLEIAAHIGSVPKPKLAIPFPLAYLTAQISEILAKYVFRSPKPLLPIAGLDLLRYGTHVDISKAKAELDWYPSPISIAIKDTIDWFRKNGYLAR